jgi:beta-lactamase regulating signal transducer with metallopeptidase domain
MAAASLMMLIVLAIRTPVARAFGAVWAYSLWLLPLGRLLLPPLPQGTPELPIPSLAVFIPAASETLGALPTESAGGAWGPILLALWLTGAALFLVVQFLSYRRFLTRLSLASRSAGAWRGLPMVESEAVDGPIAVGLLDRRIVVPADFATRYSETERRLSAEHEYVHHRRGDIWWNLAALLVLAANWWNPIAWIAFAAFRGDQELSCDAAVAARAGPEERHAYATALIKSASRPGLISACPLNHADQLKRRLKMMKTHSVSRLRSFGGAAALVTIAGAGLALAAPGAAHPHAEGEQKQRIVIMEHKDGAPGARAPGTHSFQIRRGPNGAMTLPEHCENGTELANVDETTATSAPGSSCARRPAPTLRRRLASSGSRTRARASRPTARSPASIATACSRALDRAIAQIRTQQ